MIIHISKIFIVVTLFCFSAPSAYGKVKFCAVGDVLLDRGIRKTIEEKGLNYLFDKIKPIISEHDLAFCNLESPLTPSNIGYPLLKRYSFRGETEYVQGLIYTGFNVISVANNHTIDWDRDGFMETIRILKEHNISPVGGGKNQHEAMKPTLIKRNGLIFAFFGAVSFLLEGLPYLEDKPAPAYAGIEELTTQIQRINNLVDFVIVSFHWGSENQPIPNSRQVEYAHRVIDAGADLVLGHHPHVLQSIEHYKDRFIIYSLGNFVFDNSRPHQRQTIIFSCEFSKGQIIMPKILPVTIELYRPQPASKDDFEEIVQRLTKLSQAFFTEIEVSSQTAYLTGNDYKNTTAIPLKEWELGRKTIRVYTSRLELIDLNTNILYVFPLKDETLSIKHCCLVQDKQIACVYAILGDLSEERGKRLAIFPIELEINRFKTPLLDSHIHFNPWKIRAGDVDGDGNPEILVGAWKSTRYDLVEANRLFVFNRYQETIYPKWLGSRVGFPFIDFESIDLDGDKRDELIMLETNRAGNKRIASYTWNEFGFDQDEIIELHSDADFLLQYSM